MTEDQNTQPTKERMKVMSVRIPEALREQAKKRANECRSSVSWVVRRALELYFKDGPDER